ncbi:MAG TPA: ImmA/IrrE family metallo-endopeptidase [Gaiellaceae bacterium]|nr:ImmA/IrrE family metallo-endopeptidase [Gaiellaceae bacterium]
MFDQFSTTAPERSVLASLRALVPKRPLTPREALNVAELQANRLLRHFRIESATVPEEIVSELPRIRVVRDDGLPVSGAAYWNGRYWIITVNADEPLFRQRFSLMHEFKHVLDHTSKHFLYHDRPFQTAAEQAERVADYFAACLLMPKMMVKRLWYQGNQNIVALAEKLQVSPAAMRYRLDQLGLTEGPRRCDRRPFRHASVTKPILAARSL